MKQISVTTFHIKAMARIDHQQFAAVGYKFTGGLNHCGSYALATVFFFDPDRILERHPHDCIRSKCKIPLVQGNRADWFTIQVSQRRRRLRHIAVPVILRNLPKDGVAHF